MEHAAAGATGAGHELGEAEMWDRSKGHKFSIAVHSFSSDATHTLFQNHKVQGCEAESTYVFIDGDVILTHGADVLDISFSKRAFCDLQMVVNPKAAGTHALLVKQLQGLGCPTWKNFRIGGPGCTQPLRMFFYTSDEGPDQEMFKNIAGTEIVDFSSVLFVGCRCWMHVIQLILRGGLELVDRWLSALGHKWKYYSALAKMTNVWREMGRAFYVAFLKTFGASVANECCLRIPPRCIAGRWSSVFATEQYYLTCTPARLKLLVRRVLNPSAAPEAPDPLAPPIADGGSDMVALVKSVEDPAIEAQDALRKMMGRWRREVAQVSNCSTFYSVMKIHHRVSAVVEHFMAFLSAVVPASVVVVKGGKVCQLITGRCEAFLSEYAAILRDSVWISSILAECPESEITETVVLIVSLVLHHAGGFHRRVFSELNRTST
jgi:hypothetical protein